MEAIQKPKMTFDLMAVMLTVLDRERHNATYFDAARVESDGYTHALTVLLEMHASQVPPDRVEKFVESNPHLRWIWENEKGELNPYYLAVVGNADLEKDEI